MNSIFRKYRAKRKKGFTLLEVLVVVVILGVLATIAVPTYNKIIKRSRVADGLNVLDMLAGAQDKYFVQHGIYAARLTDLNVPMKDYRVENSQAQFTNIITKNFTYDKVPEKNCIYATSNVGTNYTLVKNYKSKAKVQCSGEGCKDLAGYVDEAEDLGGLCPAGAAGEPPCEEEECPEGEHFNSELCKCVPNDPAPQSTVCTEGDTRPYNTATACGSDGCSLWTTQICKGNEWLIIKSAKTECKDAQGNLCQSQSGDSCSEGDTQYIQTNESCTSSSDGKGSGGKGTSGEGSPAAEVKCGIKYIKQKCKEKEWVNTEEYDCRQKTCGEGASLVLNLETCECETYKECDPNNNLVCSSGRTICDPCPESPSITTIIEEALVSSGGTGNDRGGNDRGTQTPEVSAECFHCGYRNSTTTKECNHTTGQWYCAGDENVQCINVRGNIPAYDGDCDGNGTEGNACGGYKLSNVRCWQEIEGGIPELQPNYSTSCSLKTGNACFSGNTRTCSLESGGYGIKECKDCQWEEECKPDLHCGPNPQCNPYASEAELRALGIASCSSDCQATCIAGKFHDGKCYEAYWNPSLYTAVYGSKKDGKDYYNIYSGNCVYREKGGGKGDGDEGDGGKGDHNPCNGCYDQQQVSNCMQNPNGCDENCAAFCNSMLCPPGCGVGNGNDPNNSSPSSMCLTFSCAFLATDKNFSSSNCSDYCKGKESGYCLTTDRVYRGAQANTYGECEPKFLPGLNVGVYWCRIAGTTSTGGGTGGYSNGGTQS